MNVWSEVAPRPWLAGVDPRTKLLALAFVSVLCVLLDSALGLVALANLSAAAVLFGLRATLRTAAAWGIATLLVVWGTMLSQAIFYSFEPRTTLAVIVPAAQFGEWHWPGIILYREGFLYGLTQSLRLVALSCAGIAVCLSTGPERLMAALVRLKAPASMAFLTVTAIRFLPTLWQEWLTVRQARRLRGYRFRPIGPDGQRLGWLRGVVASFGVLVPLLAASLRRAETLAISLAARGFDPTAGRTALELGPLPRRDRRVIAFLALLLVAVVTVKLVVWWNAGLPVGSAVDDNPTWQWLAKISREYL